MFTSEEAHLERQRYYLDLVERGDADVVAGIHSVIKDSRPGYTMESRPQSLFKLIKTNLDEPFRKWLERNEQSDLKDFSVLARTRAKGDICTGYDFLRQLGLQKRPGAIPSEYPWADESWRADEFSMTIDSLIDLLDFCGWYPSSTVKVVQTNPDHTQHDPDEAVERFGKGRKPKSRSESPDDSVPGYLKLQLKHLRDNSMCLACGRPVANKTHRKQLIKKVVDLPIRNALKANVPITAGKGRSLDYCIEHTKPGGGVAGKREGTRWRIPFMSLLRAMEKKQVGPKIHSFLAPSFMLEFACLAIRNYSSRKKLRAIESMLPLLNAKTSEELEADQIGFEIAECIRVIFFEDLRLTPKPYDAPAFTVGQINGVPFAVSGGLGLIHWPVGPATGT